MMTIKEKIDAYVLAQGNQVGAGAELASLLKEIVDSIPGEYTLPPASAETLGGVKVGSGLSITEQGVLSASGGGSALIVEGKGTDGGDTIEFEPSAGQPSKQDAIDAFRSGRIVILKYDAQIEGPHETIITDLTYQNRLQSMYIEEGGASLKPLVW